MPRVRMIYQTAATDCAPASLAMIAAHHRLGVGVAELRERLDPGRDGVTVLALLDVARDLGLPTRAVRLDPGLVATGRAPVPLPLVAHWEGRHYVVVDRIGRGRVRLADPAMGRRTLRVEEFASAATGLFLLFEATGGRAPRPTARAMGPEVRLLLAPLVVRHGGSLLLAFALTAAMTLVGLAVPLATSAITDAMGTASLDAGAWILAAVVVAAVMGALAAARTLLAAGLQRRMAQGLSVDVAGMLMSRSYRYFERRTLGDLLQRIGSARSIHELLGVVLIGAVLDGVLTLGYLAALAAWAPRLAVVTLAVLAITLALTTALGQRTAAFQREELLLGAGADSLMVDALTGIATLRVGAAEHLLLRRWSERVSRQLATGARRARAAGHGEAVQAVVRVFAPIAFLVTASQGAATPGTAIGLAALAGAALVPLGGLSHSLVVAAGIRPLLERIADIYEAPAEPSGQVVLSPLRGEIVLERVSFRYDARSPLVLDGISLRVPAGWKVGVVGATGCGKSTLVAVLTGLHVPADGVVRFDGVDLAELDLPRLRRQLGVVRQDTWLGVGTIREAVTCGRGEIDDDAVRRALAQAQVLEDVLAMPQGLDTGLAEGARSISTGQRQRIALARALVGEPSVLILDEATSALDVATEAAVEHCLRRLDITRVVIAHRLSTVADADWILVLDKGRVVEQGPPDALLDEDGPYARLAGCDPSGRLRSTHPQYTHSQ